MKIYSTIVLDLGFVFSECSLNSTVEQQLHPSPHPFTIETNSIVVNPVSLSQHSIVLGTGLVYDTVTVSGHVWLRTESCTALARVVSYISISCQIGEGIT